MKPPSTGHAIMRGLVLTFPLLFRLSLFAQAQFVPLGYLDGYGPTSEANALTPDARKVVGYSTTSLTENQACWWTRSGILAVPGVQNWYANSAYAVSADGNVVVGDRSFGGTEEAWCYTVSDQIQPIPFPQPQRSSTARGVTGDGKVIVGTAVTPGSLQAKGFRWERGQAAAIFLPQYAPSGVQNAAATDISDDGKRIVGAVQTGLSTYAAVRWDNQGAPILLSQAGDVIQAVTANAVSPDGSLIVGSAVNNATGKGVGFRWTAATGVVALANPTDGFYAIDVATAVNVSGNGQVIVGYGNNVAGDDEAIFWVDGNPHRVSSAVLAAGVLPPQWETFRAYGVDYFGNTICGYGRATSGKLEGYVFFFDATPAPSTLVPPVLGFSYAQGQGLSIRYLTLPGLKYRVHGGTEVQSLAPVEDWQDGLGIEREFITPPAAVGRTSRYFLRLEIAPQ